MKRYLFFGGFLLFLSKVCFAQNLAEDILPTVVVTATRTEIPPEQLSTALTVITAEEIRQQQAETVLEVLRAVPALDVVQSGSRGNATSVFIRGSESDHVLVLIDGVEVNSTTTGEFDFAHLTTENIERIEILRGSGGTLYGSQAIGGVIQIFTKIGRGKPEMTFSAEGGNGRTHRQALALNGGTERLGYSFSASRLETAGFHRFNDDYQNLAASSRLDLRLTDSSLLRGVFHFRKTDVGLFNNNNFIDIPDPNARENVTDYLAKLGWEQRLSPSWDYRLAGSLFKQHDKFSDDPEPGSFDVRRRNRFRPRVLTGEFQSNYRWQEWGTTTIGIEYKNRQARTENIREEQRNLGYYLQQQMGFLSNRLLLVGGIRLDDHQVFGTEWSPSASVAYVIPGSGTKFKFGYAEGFKAPTMNELFFPRFGNPDLGPETSWEVNAGVEQKFFGRFLAGATYFYREVKDLIEFAPPTFQARNLGKVRLNGIEIFGDFPLNRALAVRTAYTFLTGETSTGSLPRRPRHRGHIQLRYQQDACHINLNTRIVGKRDDIGVLTGATVKEAGYVKLDLASSYVLPWKPPGVRDLSLFGKIENLLDKKYEEADGFRARPLNFSIGLRAVLGSE